VIDFEYRKTSAEELSVMISENGINNTKREQVREWDEKMQEHIQSTSIDLDPLIWGFCIVMIALLLFLVL
jgi:hypothetical protein